MAVAAAVVLMSSAPTAAGAPLGQTFTPGSGCGFSPPGGSITFLQSESAGGVYTVAAPGVINAWSVEANESTAQIKFKVGRPVGGDLFTIIGESPPVTPPTNQRSTHPVQIPVLPGDVIGVYLSGFFPCGTIASGYTARFRGTQGANEDVLPGTTMSFQALPDPPGWQLNIAANLETAPCEGRSPTIAGTEGSDSLAGTPAADVIVAFGGDDDISGADGDDVICAGAGKDSVNGGSGKDELIGGSGRDTLRGSSGKDKLIGEGGRDKLRGGGGRDACKGGKSKDSAKGCEVERSI